MHAVKMVADILELDRNVSDRWYVSSGAASVGPVSLDLVVRGVEAGKIPLESFMRNETWKVWRPLMELVAQITLGEPAEAPPQIIPALAPPSTEEMQSSLRGDDMSPEDAIAGATDAKEALLLLMSSAVRELGADAALVHEAREDGAIVVCAHGGDLFEGLGERVPLTDPAIVAGASGHVIVAEPVAGPTGAVIRRRLGRGRIGKLEGAAMFSIGLDGRFFGMLEIGRRTRFSARELARVEILVEVLVARLAVLQK